MKNTDVTLKAKKDEYLGEINIVTNVLEVIATQAASEVDGVIPYHSLGYETSRFFSRGVNLSNATADINEFGEISVDVNIQIQYGYTVPTVALAVQDRVKEQILFMTDLIVQQVNVHVIAIDTDKNPSSAQYYVHKD